MASIETRTRQETLAKWDEVLKGKPTRENSTGPVETKKESVKLFKRLLREKPGRNVEIKVYWPGRKGKIDEVTLSRKIVEGKEVYIKGPSAIRQIVELSVKKGMPEGLSVKTVNRLNVEDYIKGGVNSRYERKDS